MCYFVVGGNLVMSHDHNVEFNITFSSLEEMVRKYAEENDIPITGKGTFSFRIAREERMGFVLDKKETALGVLYTSK